jgi:uncharacterized membrane protein HdeD (DUF308 family)
MAQEQLKTKKHGQAFWAGALFALAGLLEMTTGFRSHGGIGVPLGVMFLCVGMLWIGIGAKWKKEQQQRSE